MNFSDGVHIADGGVERVAQDPHLRQPVSFLGRLSGGCTGSRGKCLYAGQ